MSGVIPIGARDIAAFEPVQTREKIARIDGDIVTFRQLHDWPSLAAAATEKIAEQTKFVANWDAKVGIRQHENQHTLVNTQGHGPSMSVEEAFDAWGIAQPTVSRWRTSLRHPDKYHERIMRGSLRAAGLIEDEASEYHAPLIPDGRFGTIVIDPPWDMHKIEREVRPNQAGFDYPTMSGDELLAWPVARDMAADDCHLFCWTTQKWLPFTINELLPAWDFRYVLTMVWHKPGGFQPMRLPQYNCEFIVYARRGAPVFVDTTDFPCCFAAPRREHSRKPEAFYDLVRRVTDEPRIDVFSREARDGFEQYGNQTGMFG